MYYVGRIEGYGEEQLDYFCSAQCEEGMMQPVGESVVFFLKFSAWIQTLRTGSGYTNTDGKTS